MTGAQARSAIDDGAADRIDAAPATAAGRAEQSRTLAVLIVTVLFGLQLMDGIDQTVLAFTAPALRAEFGLGPKALGAAFSAGFLGTALGSIVFGTLGDRVGRKIALVLSAAGFSLASFCTVFVHTGGALFAIRLATGIALGGLFPIIASIILATVGEGFRATAVTIVSVGTAAGAALCGPLVAVIEPRFGWRAMFVVGGAGPAIFLMLAILLVPRAPVRWSSATTRPDRVGNPLESVLTLFRDGRWKVTLLIWIAFIASAVPMFFSLSWLPSFARTARLAPGAAALGPSIFSVAGLLTALVVARIIDRIGIRALAITSVLGVPAFIVLGRAFGGETYFLAACAVAGAISVGCVNLMGAVAAMLYPDDLRSRGVGWAVAVMRLGGAVAPGLGGILIARGLRPEQIFLGLAISPAIAALAVWRLWRLRRGDRRGADIRQTAIRVH